MDRGISDLKNPARKLPDLVLPSGSTGSHRNVRSSGRRAPVVVLVHGASCALCREYVEQLSAAGPDLRDWDGEIVVVAPDAPTEIPASEGVTHLQDVGTRLERALAVSPPAIAIADQWGVIRALEPAGEGHRFLAVDEVVEWLRFLAIECPECEGEAF
jgi:hypothetical protein